MDESFPFACYKWVCEVVFAKVDDDDWNPKFTGIV